MTTIGMKRSPHPSPRKTKSREQARAIITNPKLLLYNRGATILGSVQLIMNTGYYSLVFAIPLTMIVLILISAWYILNRKVPNSSLWLAAYAFPNIIEKKTDENRQTTWQVKDTDLEEGSALLSKIVSISWLFATLAAFTLIMFFYLLLINVSYDCDPDEKSKDCFEFKRWDTARMFSNVPIDCSSDAILNGSVKVVCYEIVFDISKAVGVSYGVFKI